MPLASVAPPEARAEWMAPINSIHPREFESASSLEALLSCPLQWTLKYASRLRPGVRQSLPKMDNLVGTLAHRIAQEIFQPGAPPEPMAVRNHRSPTVRRTAAADRRHAVASRRSRRTRRGQALDPASARGTRPFPTFGEPDRRRRRIRVLRRRTRATRSPQEREPTGGSISWRGRRKDASSSSTSNGSAAKADVAQS